MKAPRRRKLGVFARLGYDECDIVPGTWHVAAPQKRLHVLTISMQGALSPLDIGPDRPTTAQGWPRPDTPESTAQGAFLPWKSSQL